MSSYGRSRSIGRDAGWASDGAPSQAHIDVQVARISPPHPPLPYSDTLPAGMPGGGGGGGAGAAAAAAVAVRVKCTITRCRVGHWPISYTAVTRSTSRSARW
jgi:hypothetical protein